MIFANILDITHYFLLSAYSGCITKVIALVRNEIIIVKEKHKKSDKIVVLVILLTLLIVYLISGILTYEDIFSGSPILAAMIYLYVWNGNELQVKKAALYCYFL